MKQRSVIIGVLLLVGAAFFSTSPLDGRFPPDHPYLTQPDVLVE